MIEQGLELRPRQPHHAVLHRRPGEAPFVEPLVDQHQPRAVPDQDLYAVAALGPEDDSQAGMRVEPELVSRTVAASPS